MRRQDIDNKLVMGLHKTGCDRVSICNTLYHNNESLAARQYNINRYGYTLDELKSYLYECIHDYSATYDAKHGVDYVVWLICRYRSYLQQQFRYSINHGAVHVPLAHRESLAMDACDAIDDHIELGSSDNLIKQFEDLELIDVIKQHCIKRYPKYVDDINKWFTQELTNVNKCSTTFANKISKQIKREIFPKYLNEYIK